MNTNPIPDMPFRTRIHPLVAGAAVAVILASATGIAAMTGLLPSSHASMAAPALAAPAVAQTGSATLNAAQPYAEQRPVVEEAPRREPVHHHHVVQATPAPSYATGNSYRRLTEPAAPRQTAVDPNAGDVVAINAVQAPEPATGIGAVGGAVAGGLLGNQIGQGRGRVLATIAGAIGGGLAGNGIEHVVHKTTTYQVQVHMADGSYRSFSYPTEPTVQVGERVHVYGDTLSAS
jgi:outer membrane lipoprotein SlyB